MPNINESINLVQLRIESQIPFLDSQILSWILTSANTGFRINFDLLPSSEIINVLFIVRFAYGYSFFIIFLQKPLL